MKKSFFLFILMLLSLYGFCQKVIENPKYRAITASFVKPIKIVLQNDAVIIGFEVEYYPGERI